MWPDSLSTHIYYIQLYDALNCVLPSKLQACITKVKCEIYKEWSCRHFISSSKNQTGFVLCTVCELVFCSGLCARSIVFSCMLLLRVSGFGPFQMHLCCHICTCSVIRLSEIPDDWIFCVAWLWGIIETIVCYRTQKVLCSAIFIYLSCTRLFFFFCYSLS